MQLKDSLSQSLQTVDKNKLVKFYSCGPTVYDYPHIGNWYAFLRWELIARTLRYQNYDLLWVMNITDVGHLVSDNDEGEDKLVKQAGLKKTDAFSIANYYSQYFAKALERLNFSMPDLLPKATQYIDQQIELVKKLEALNLTYLIDDGLYYDTSKLKDYGKLSKKASLESDFKPRIDSNTQKKNPTDFALWKLSPKGQKRDMEWDSPWGIGFPGWHIECSAMAEALLKTPLTIHAGGIDHIPIHHTNEIAQSEPVFGSPMSEIWIHSNFITINGSKMSKSLNNFITLEDIEVRGYNFNVFRLAVLSSRYFNLVDFNWNLMELAQQKLVKLQNLSAMRFQLNEDIKLNKDKVDNLNRALQSILNALNDNLNSPLALEHLENVASLLSCQNLSTDILNDLNLFLKQIDDLLGLNLLNIPNLNQNQEDILKNRLQARLNKDYNLSDELRKKLQESNISVIDREDRQYWGFIKPI